MWKYQGLLNADLVILLTIVVGAAAVIARVFKRSDAAVFSTFLFCFTLPASVIEGLGIKTDLYDSNIWRFVGAFLIMRAIMLACSAALVGGLGRRSLGEVTAMWLNTTWISTVILGVPLLSSLYGTKYGSLGVVAGVSSFIFQLPLMLVLFEVHCWRRDQHAALPSTVAASPEGSGGGPAQHGSEEGKAAAAGNMASLKALPTEGSDADLVASSTAAGMQPGQPTLTVAPRPDISLAAVPPPAAAHPHPLALPLPAPTVRRRAGGALGGWRMSRGAAKRLGLRLLHNMVLWGVAIGLILSLSKIGPKWLDPGSPPQAPNCTYAAGAGFIFGLMDYFARCTEPVALFGTGMWLMHTRAYFTAAFRRRFWRTLAKAAVYMTIKLVLEPLLMVGCAAAVGLDGVLARSAVLVAALPISSAAFALATTYGVGEEDACLNVFLGNLLILPTTIAWSAAMDSIGLWVVPTVSSSPPAACVTPPPPPAKAG